MESLISIVTWLLFVSVSAERFTDMTKLVLKAKFENINGAVYQVLAFGFGAAVQWFEPIDIQLFDPKITAILVGLSVSGGSGLWHEVLSFLNNFNEKLKSNTVLLSTKTEKE